MRQGNSGYQVDVRARAIIKAAPMYLKVLLEVSENLTGAMKGLAVSGSDQAHMLQTRGWQVWLFGRRAPSAPRAGCR
jgi:hypothetical protein